MSEERKPDIWMLFIRGAAIMGMAMLSFFGVLILNMKSTIDRMEVRIENLQSVKNEFYAHKAKLAHDGQVQWNSQTERTIEETKLELKDINNKLDILVSKVK